MAKTTNRVMQLRRELGRSLGEAQKGASVKAVHSLRTTARRLDVMLASVAEFSDAKLRKQLKKLRRRAGEVRDLDIQQEVLKAVQLAGAAQAKERVARVLERRRRKSEDRLRTAAAKEGAKATRRLKEFARYWQEHRTEGESPVDTVAATLDRFAAAADLHKENAPATLHALRIEAKKARYFAETASGDRAAQKLARELKRLQDAVGEWRDSDLLIGTAEKILKHPQRSPLIAALRAQAQARWLSALRVRDAVTAKLLAQRAALGGKIAAAAANAEAAASSVTSPAPSLAASPRPAAAGASTSARVAAAAPAGAASRRRPTAASARPVSATAGASKRPVSSSHAARPPAAKVS